MFPVYPMLTAFVSRGGLLQPLLVRTLFSMFTVVTGINGSGTAAAVIPAQATPSVLVLALFLMLIVASDINSTGTDCESDMSDIDNETERGEGHLMDDEPLYLKMTGLMITRGMAALTAGII